MGCDIHTIWHKRTSTGWELIDSTYDEGRDYDLFGILADVRRHDIPPISEPRGIPRDFQIDDKDEGNIYAGGQWLGDHSHSWLTGAEMLNWYNRQSSQLQEDTAYFFNEVKRLVDLHGEIRFVFGFDN